MLNVCVVLAALQTVGLAYLSPRVKPPTAPAVPEGTSDQDKKALTKIELSLSRGNFTEAAADLKTQLPPPVTNVFFDWASVPVNVRAEYAGVSANALVAWNSAMVGKVRFVAIQHVEEADLVFIFNRDVVRLTYNQPSLICEDVEIQATPRGRSATAYIAVNAPQQGQVHKLASITHMICQGIGTFLGLGASTDIKDVMGPDSHTGTVATRPTDAEIHHAVALNGVRQKLLDYARRSVTVYLPKPVIKVLDADQDHHDTWRGDPAKFEYHVKNEGDAPLEIDVKPHCGCTVATFDKVIKAGATGTVTLDLSTIGMRGRVQKTADVNSNDPLSPTVPLTLAATIKPCFTVLPSETPTIVMGDEGPAVQELKVQVATEDGAEIQNAVSSSANVQTKLERNPNDAREYDLTLTIGPEAPRGRSSFAVTLYTTSKREPQVNVTAMVENGILATPTTIYMGTIQQNTPLPVTQYLTVSRREGKFHVTKVECSDPLLKVVQETIKDGQEYRVGLQYNGGWSSGTVQAHLTVTTDDPKQPTIGVLIMAYVAPAGQ